MYMQLDKVCHRECSNGCKRVLKLETIQKYRFSFWDSRPKLKERRSKIQDLLNIAKKEYTLRKDVNLSTGEPSSSPLCFVVNKEVVCEKTFAYLIGQTEKETGCKSKMWNDEVNFCLGK
jgi:hypothetical protein